MLDLQREEAGGAHSTAHMLQNMVEQLCPEEDPTDWYAARKQKLDDMHGIIGEELYALKAKGRVQEGCSNVAIEQTMHVLLNYSGSIIYCYD